MYAIEFETDITGQFIELQDYEKLLNKRARVIVLVEESSVPVQTADKPQSKKPIATFEVDQFCNEANSDFF